MELSKVRFLANNIAKTKDFSVTYYLNVVIKYSERHQQHDEPRQTIASDNKGTQHSIGLRQEYVEDEWKSIVYRIDIGGKSIHNSTYRGDVKEADGCLEGR